MKSKKRKVRSLNKIRKRNIRKNSKKIKKINRKKVQKGGSGNTDCLKNTDFKIFKINYSISDEGFLLDKDNKLVDKINDAENALEQINELYKVIAQEKMKQNLSTSAGDQYGKNRENKNSQVREDEAGTTEISGGETVNENIYELKTVTRYKKIHKTNQKFIFVENLEKNSAIFTYNKTEYKHYKICKIKKN